MENISCMSPMVSHLDLGWLAYSEWAGKRKRWDCAFCRHCTVSSERPRWELLRVTEQNQLAKQRHQGGYRCQGGLIASNNQPLLCGKVKSAPPSTMNGPVEVSLQWHGVPKNKKANRTWKIRRRNAVKVVLAPSSGRPGPTACLGWAGGLRNCCFLLWPPWHFQRCFTESYDICPSVETTTPFSYSVSCVSSALPSWVLPLYFFLHLMENRFFQSSCLKDLTNRNMAL